MNRPESYTTAAGYDTPDAICQHLDAVTSRTKDVGTVVSWLSSIVCAMKIEQFESKVQARFEAMIERLGGDKSPRFSKHTRSMISRARVKLGSDVDRETRRLKAMSYISPSLRGL